MNPFQTWMQKATLKQKQTLARFAGTTLGTLRQLAGGYRTDGKVSATPMLARRIEEAAIRLGQNQNGLPEIMREDLCIACGQCELAKRARLKRRAT